MVNLATGELVYNMPLLEVPGPAGGYPMSLSYHAGIKPGQEASWVGLGFTLNPGAINRTVNGFADDNYNTRREMHDYWDGGETTVKSKTLGLSVPAAGVGIYYTFDRTQDTFKGFSSSHYGGLSYNFNVANVAASIASAAYPVSAADQANIPPGPQLTMIRDAFSGGSLPSAASMDVSIGASGVKTSMTVAGLPVGGGSNSAGGMSQFVNSSTNTALYIPFAKFAGSLTLRDFYCRYWSDQSDALYSYGSLYPEGSVAHSDRYMYEGVEQPANGDSRFGEFRSFTGDIYDLPATPNVTLTPSREVTVWDQADPTRQAAGTLPATDQYVVTGQGIGGVIEPQSFENATLHGQNSYFKVPVPALPGPLIDYKIIDYKSLHNPTPGKRLDFRFKNDFSNSMQMDMGSFSSGTGSADISLTVGSAHADNTGYDETPTRQKLAGSRDIQWFTTAELRNGAAQAKGFIDCYLTKIERRNTMDIYNDYLQPEACLAVPESNTRSNGRGLFKDGSYPVKPADSYKATDRYPSLKPYTIHLDEKIGGFMITNESGVTYHYGLPVYSYNEYTRIRRKKPLKGAATINEIKNNEPYAYTWLLTAITGPDFVDRGGANGNPNGVLDDQDFGYWVKFEYGRWANAYQWRTPHTGYMSDFESEFESFSHGIKELYYLDAIETKSHKAFFVKSKRNDGRGVTSRLEGGSNPRKYNMRYKFNGTKTDPQTSDGSEVNDFRERGSLTFSVSPVSTLKLDAIYLYDKKDLESIPIRKDGGDKYDNAPSYDPHVYHYAGQSYKYDNAKKPGLDLSVSISTQDYIPVTYHNGDLVLDDEDISLLESQHSEFKAKALKVIEFKTDYSLSTHVANNIAYVSDMSSPYMCSDGNTCSSEGFDFEWPSNVPQGCTSWASCCNVNDQQAFYSIDPYAKFYQASTGTCQELGYDIAGRDAIKFERTGRLTLKELHVLGLGGENLLPATTFAYANNPQSDAGKYDDWGYHKSDYVSGTGMRRITALSAADVDAWSLSEITLPTGGKVSVEYEANTFRKSVYNNDEILSIENIERISTDRIKVTFKEKGINLADFFSVNQNINLNVLIMSNTTSYEDGAFSDFYKSSGISDRVSEVNQDNIVVQGGTLNQFLAPNRIMLIPGTNLLQAVTPHFVAGCVVVDEDESTPKYAGGVRVSAVHSDEFDGHRRTTRYGYAGISSASSGVTSYKPFQAVSINFPEGNEFFDYLTSRFDWQPEKVAAMSDRAKFQNRLNALYFPVLLFSREAPAPGAIYEYVTVTNEYDGMAADNYTRHQFRVFQDDMITREGTGVYAYTITNDAVNVGNLLAVERFAKDGKLLEETRYGYLYDEVNEPFEEVMRNRRQGTVEQVFNKYMVVKDWDFESIEDGAHELSNTQQYAITRHIDRSNAVSKVTHRNYKLDIGSATENHDFDYYSGQPIKTVTRDGAGNRIMTVIKPAYTVGEYSGMTATQLAAGTVGMGLKLKNSGNKNMLTQLAGSTSYKVDANNNYLGVLSATAQTWTDQIDAINTTLSRQKQPGVWRKQAGYVFVGDPSVAHQQGNYPVANFTAFTSWTANIIPTVWQLGDSTSLFDVYSHELESKDMNGDYQAIRFTSDLQRPTAMVANARYDEFVYTGFEAPTVATDGGVSYDQSALDASRAHSGKASLAIAAAGNGPLTELKIFNAGKDARGVDRGAIVSFWVYAKNTPSLELWHLLPGSIDKHPITIDVWRRAGDWYLCEFTMARTVIPALNNTTLKLQLANVGQTTAYIDDFRIHPADASMVSYVYDNRGMVSHILDDNNLYMHYEYDAMGRLTSTWRESFRHGKDRAAVKLQEVDYHYKGHTDK
ncbi:hypothetical protein [Parachryseolinea silvisoli]|uniref:hypothetical protein n=1 Tax=Parachryseolinea silvisoli TaxID=2873601 RepID=UPI002265E458|nr:hypothetical protein [Parachryseolinea silvisoli]MCD9017900.1 hypothetical protein [Parachryseolinea silvisoli]